MVEDQERVDGGGDEEAVVFKKVYCFFVPGFALVVAGIIVMIVAGGWVEGLRALAASFSLDRFQLFSDLVPTGTGWLQLV